MSIARAAAIAEVNERRHLTHARQRVAAIERSIRLIMAANPLFGSPPLEARQLLQQLGIAKNAEAMALKDWQSSRRVAALARATR